MLKFLSPSLLALTIALGGGAALDAATAPAAATNDGDQQALAVNQLIKSGFRLPAQRQLDEFKAAGYADPGQWIEKALREQFIDHFHALPSAGGAAAVKKPATDPKADPAKDAVDPKVAAELKALRDELDAAMKANKLPATAKSIHGGGGGSLFRMVVELTKLVHPDLPQPLVDLAPEKKAAATKLADALCKQLEEDFKKDLDGLKAHKADEEEIWNLDEKNPRYAKLVGEACDLRIEALRNAYLAILALREVGFRGKDFGIEPAQIATNAFLKKFFTDYREALSQWDFEWGEFSPYIRAYANALLSQAVRVGAKDAKDDEVENGLLGVIDFDLKNVKVAKSREEGYRLKLIAWGNLLRWRLELGTERSYKRGIQAWTDFQERAKAEPFYRLANVPKSLADDLGKVYILGARLYKAKGDLAAANGLLGELIGATPANPLAYNAKLWLASFSGQGASGGGGGWSQAPIALSPATAINIARAFMSEANATADPQRQRSNYLNAAVALRNATLALNGAEDKVLVESGPQVYQLYAYTLYKLEMRHHAAIAALEGARVFAAYLEALAQAKKPNPWLKAGSKEWDETHTTPRKLALDAYKFASSLYIVDKNTQRISDDVIDQLKRISPSDVGKELEWAQVVLSFQDGDYAGCVAKAQEYGKKYPEDIFKAFQLTCSVRAKWIEKLAKDGGTEKIKSIQQDTAADNEEMLKHIETIKNPTPEQQKLIESTQLAILSTKVEGMIADKKYTEAMDLLTPKLTKSPPTDENLAARLLRLLAKSAAEYNRLVSAGDKAKDAQVLMVNWKRYSDIYRCAQKLLPKLQNKGVDTEIKNASTYLAQLFSTIPTQVFNIQHGGGNPPAAIGDYIEEANRAFADLYEPWIDAKTPPANILFCANKLWDVDEKERAARLYLQYQKTLDEDAELQAFEKDPKPTLDKYGEVIASRGEFKKAWEEIVDLSYDSPEWLEAYNKGLTAEQMPPGQHADYFKALAKIAEFRAKSLQPQKVVIAPEQYKAIEASLTQLERLLGALANDLVVKKHLAQHYRESNQFEKALPILQELYRFDTRDPDAQLAIINLTRKAMFGGSASKDDLTKARDLAAGVRNNIPPKNKLGYWEAYTLVEEFRIGLGDAKPVNEDLSFMRRNKSDLSRDLVAPSVDGDDKRVRRAMNAQAVDLCKRFLELYTKSGVTEKPSFRVDEIDAGGRTIGIFTDIDAPKFMAKTIKDKDDNDVLVIVPEGAADAAAPAPAAAAPAAAPAPAAAQPASK
jgi:hypothetical protein